MKPGQALRENRALRRALEKAAGSRAIYMPNPGNIGDGVIALGSWHLLESWGLDFPIAHFEDDLCEYDHLIFGGGGGLVSGLYYEPQKWILDFLVKGGSVTILPSTIVGLGELFAPYADRLEIFTREKESFSSLIEAGFPAKRAHLCPDMAFGLDPGWLKRFSDRPARGELSAFRGDGEALWREAQDSPLNVDVSLFINGMWWHDRENTTDAVARLARYLASYRTIRSDRLHVSILAALLGRQVEMHPGVYYKNAAVHAYSLSSFRNVTFHAEPPKPTKLSDDETKEPAWESLRRKLTWYESTRRDWWEPKLQEYEAGRLRMEKELSVERERLTRLEAEIERLVAEEPAAEIEAQRARLTAVTDERDAAVTRLAEREQENAARIEEFTRLLSDRTRALDAAQQSWERLASEKQQALDAARAQAAAAAAETVQACRERDDLERRLRKEEGERLTERDDLAARLEEAEARAGRTEAERQALAQAAQAAKDHLKAERDDLATRLEEAEAAIGDLILSSQERQAELSREVEALRTALAAAKEAEQYALGRFDDNWRAHEAALEDLKAALAAAEAQNAADREASRVEIDALRRQVDDAKASFQHERRRLVGVSREIDEYRSRLDSVREELQASRAWAAELDDLRQTWFQPELARLSQRIEALEGELAESQRFAQELNEVSRTCHEPEIERLSRRVLELEQCNEDFARYLAEAQAWAEELYEMRKTWHEPEIDRLTAELERSRAEVNHLDGELRHVSSARSLRWARRIGLWLGRRQL